MVEAYIDDIVVKSKRVGNPIQDLKIVFSCLWANNIKLNPEKCVFGVPQGVLLGYIVSQHGIEVNPRSWPSKKWDRFETSRAYRRLQAV